MAATNAQPSPERLMVVTINEMNSLPGQVTKRTVHTPAKRLQ